ncbi:hypothetical protein VIBHAR_05542 [Vibrio campbellii ATCC BAA-1116]|uniref:Uncharacterized protein n=1 Tax=Vibrio campbellii (strain ATCC BAA-1116) TaxID=2902295 RepID=A7N4A4_VIBC1|nr:hypothetical protein VIBHAR_05542 [Vibrio campbellii ATCC BAA-1116]
MPRSLRQTTWKEPSQETDIVEEGEAGVEVLLNVSEE